MSRFLLPVWALILAACQGTMPDPGCTPDAAERQNWTATTRSNTADAYRKYLAAYPSGCYARQATQWLRKPVKAVAVPPMTSPATGAIRVKAY